MTAPDSDELNTWQKLALILDDLAKEVDMNGPSGRSTAVALEQIRTLTNAYARKVAEEAISLEEPELGYGSRDGEYEMHYHRNKLRAEQKQRLNALLGEKK